LLAHARREGWVLSEILGPGRRPTFVQRASLAPELLVALAQRDAGAAPEPPTDPELSAAYLRASDTARDEAMDRLHAVVAAKAARNNDATLADARRAGAEEYGRRRVQRGEPDTASAASIKRWVAAVENRPRCDWLPALLTKYRGGAQRDVISKAAMDFALAYIKEASGRSPLMKAYRVTVKRAKRQGWLFPSYVTFLARLREELSPAAFAMLRHGPKARDLTIPSQQRSVADDHSMKTINLDGRTADVMVKWEDGTIGRPTVLGVQDVFSRYMLTLHICRSENIDATKAALLNVFTNYGVPLHFVTDNSRAFASKALTGGTRTRFRGKVRDDDPAGMLTALGIIVHFATVAHGQAKPVERGFRDFSENTDTRPEFRGAYVGNKPDAKPEDYGATAVPIAEFRRIYAEEMHDHNERIGRRTEMAQRKLSFQQVFDASLAQHAPRVLTEPQRHWCMLTPVPVKPHKDTGTLTVDGFRYWSAEHQGILLKHRNGKLFARIDPRDRSLPILVEDAKGRVLIDGLPCLRVGQFLSTEDAREHAKFVRRARRAAKEEIKNLELASRKLTLEMLRQDAAAHPDHEPPPASNITAPVFGVPSAKGRGSARVTTPTFTAAEVAEFEAAQLRGLEIVNKKRRQMG
jgi:hypothetical protein